MSEKEVCGGEFWQVPPQDHIERYQWAAEILVRRCKERSLDRIHPLVLDVGCGSGYGSRIIKDLSDSTFPPGAGLSILGIDRNPLVSAWCKKHRIPFKLQEYPIKGRVYATVMFEVVEHNVDGLELLQQACVNSDIVLASVPYKEAPGVNEYHVLHNLTEASFAWMKPQPQFLRPYEYSLSIYWEKPGL